MNDTRPTTVVRAPFTGLLVGVLENPVLYPGNPLCHLLELEDETLWAIGYDELQDRIRVSVGPAAGHAP